MKIIKITLILVLVFMILAVAGIYFFDMVNRANDPIIEQYVSGSNPEAEMEEFNPASSGSTNATGTEDSIGNDATENNNNEEQADDVVEEKDSKPPLAKPTTTPKSLINLAVPFVSQAPYGVWDELHQETCEEASMIMAVNFLNNQPLTAHIMEQGLLNLVKWQTDKGYQVDLNAEEVVEVLDEYFGQKASILEDVTLDNIVAELSKGNLLLAPAAGRNLGNPNFTPPGPVYHMLVIRGYDPSTGEIITNDPGTRSGEGYRYKTKTLLNAIADWDHSLAVDGMTQSEIEQGRQVLVVVEKP